MGYYFAAGWQRKIISYNNSIATKVLEVPFGVGELYNNCLFANGLEMDDCTGTYRLSIKVLPSSARDGNSCGVCICVAPDDAWYDKDPFVSSFDTYAAIGFGMHPCEGCLHGDETDSSEKAGEVAEGLVLTMELDTDAHILKFWVDGKLHSSGFTTGVIGSLRCALSIGDSAIAVQVVWSADITLEECYFEKYG